MTETEKNELLAHLNSLSAGSMLAWMGIEFVDVGEDYLVAIILTVVPVSALLKRLSAPLLRQKIQAQKARYGWPSGE